MESICEGRCISQRETCLVPKQNRLFPKIDPGNELFSVDVVICCLVSIGGESDSSPPSRNVCRCGTKHRESESLKLPMSIAGLRDTRSDTSRGNHPCAIKWSPQPSLFSEPLFPLSLNIPSRTSSTSWESIDPSSPSSSSGPPLVVSASQASPLCTPVAKITRVVLARLFPARLQRRTH